MFLPTLDEANLTIDRNDMDLDFPDDPSFFLLCFDRFFAAFIEVDDLDEVKVVLIFDFPDTNGKGNVLVAQLQGNTAGVGRFDSAVPHGIVL